MEWPSWESMEVASSEQRIGPVWYSGDNGNLSPTRSRVQAKPPRLEGYSQLIIRLQFSLYLEFSLLRIWSINPTTGRFLTYKTRNFETEFLFLNLTNLINFSKVGLLVFIFFGVSFGHNPLISKASSKNKHTFKLAVICTQQTNKKEKQNKNSQIYSESVLFRKQSPRLELVFS